MADYKTNAAAVTSATFKNAPVAASLLMDIADELVVAGNLEKLEDALTDALKEYLSTVLTHVQAKMGAYAKFAGDMADDPEAAVDFLLAKGDELVAGGAIEPLMDSLVMIARPFLVTALMAQQAKLAALEIAAED